MKKFTKLMGLVMVFFIMIAPIDVFAFQGDCENYNVFIADNPRDGEQKCTIYDVTMEDDGTASLVEFASVNYRLHMAYDEMNNVLYLVQNRGKFYQVLDVDTKDLSDPVNLDASVHGHTTAVAYQDGNLYIGSDGKDKIFTYNVGSEVLTELELEGDIKVQGGDLVIKDDVLYLASKFDGGTLYTIKDGTVQTSDISDGVMGMSSTASNQLYLSRKGKEFFELVNVDGTSAGEDISLFLGDDPYRIQDGDLAAGCDLSQIDPGPIDTCGLIQNGDFENFEDINVFGTKGKFDFENGDVVGGWLNRAGTQTMEIQRTGRIDNNDSYDGSGHHLELNGKGLDEIYQIIDTNPGSTLDISFYHKKRAYGDFDSLELLFGPDLDNLESLGMFEVTKDEDWRLQEKNAVVVPDGQTKSVLLFKAIKGTNDTTGNLIDAVCVTENMVNEPPVGPSCDTFEMYYAEIVKQGSTTNIYGITLNDETNEAELSEPFVIEGERHIAFDTSNGNLYAIDQKGNGAIAIIKDNVIVEEFDTNITRPYAMAYNENDGLLYIGSDNKNQIVKLDPKTGIVDLEVVAENVPVKGGDLAFNDDVLFLASREIDELEVRGLYTIDLDTGTAELVDDNGLIAMVNGLALTADGNLLSANAGQTAFNLLDGKGGSTGRSYENSLGIRFDSGDLASGCKSPDTQDPCDNFQMYYANIDKTNGKQTTIHTVTLEGGQALLSDALFDAFDGPLHISLNTDNGLIYGAGAGSDLIVFNKDTGRLADIELRGEEPLEGIVTNVYRNGMVYLGSGSQDRIVEVNLNTGEYTNVVTNIPVAGGDIVFIGDQMYLATRDVEGYITKVDREGGSTDYDDMINQDSQIDIEKKVNGMLLTSDGDFLVATEGTSTFTQIDPTSGNIVATFTTVVGDTTLTLQAGDLASGCVNSNPDPDDCDGPVSIVNGSFEDEFLNGYTLNGGWAYVPEDNVNGWMTNDGDNGIIEIQKSGAVNGNLSANADDESPKHYELNGNGLNTLYQKVCTNNVDNLNVSFAYKKRQSSGDDKFNLYVVGSLDDITDANAIEVMPVAYTENKGEWMQASFDIVIPDSQTETYIYFEAVEGTSLTIGNLLDEISVSSTLAVPTDLVAYSESVQQTLSTREQFVVDNDITMYPVPANNELNVTLRSKIGGDVSYEIVSIMGQSFNRGKVNAFAGETNIKANISNLADGTYFFVMNVGGTTITKQFVKMKR